MNKLALKNTQQLTIPKPFMKWVGGNSQLLDDLMDKVPSSFGSYIEHFIGGGAMLFTMQPSTGVIHSVSMTNNLT